jgi:hypothetical protein
VDTHAWQRLNQRHSIMDSRRENERLRVAHISNRFEVQQLKLGLTASIRMPLDRIGAAGIYSRPHEIRLRAAVLRLWVSRRERLCVGSAPSFVQIEGPGAGAYL